MDRPDDGIASVGVDQALLDDGVPVGAGADGRLHGRPRRLLGGDGVHQLQQVGMDDEGVVVVPVQLGTVAVDAVAQVPGGVLAKGVIDAGAVPLFAEREKAGLDDRVEEQPVIEGWGERMGLTQGLRQLCPHRRGQLLLQLLRRAQQAQCEEGRVDDVLVVDPEVP